MIQFKGSHFPKSVILQSVYWYLRYSLSYRDIEELMQERGVEVDHATIQVLSQTFQISPNQIIFELALILLVLLSFAFLKSCLPEYEGL